MLYAVINKSVKFMNFAVIFLSVKFDFWIFPLSKYILYK